MVELIFNITQNVFLLMDISKYDEAIQKAINNFEEEIATFKQKQKEKYTQIKNKAEEIAQELQTIKKTLQEDV